MRSLGRNRRDSATSESNPRLLTLSHIKAPTRPHLARGERVAAVRITRTDCRVVGDRRSSASSKAPTRSEPPCQNARGKCLREPRETQILATSHPTLRSRAQSVRRSGPYDQECSKQVAWRSHAICLANGGAYGYGGEFTLNNNTHSRHVACGSTITYYFPA